MKILSKCECCHKRKLFIFKRIFNAKHVGKVTSKSLLCGKCARYIKTKI